MALPDDLVTRLNGDPYIGGIGAALVSIAPGTATYSLTIGPAHLNFLGIGHGAVIFALADAAFAAACNSHGVGWVAAGVDIRFKQAVTVGTRLEATAREAERLDDRGVYPIEVLDVDSDTVVAKATGHARRKRPAT